MAAAIKGSFVAIVPFSDPSKPPKIRKKPLQVSDILSKTLSCSLTSTQRCYAGMGSDLDAA